MRRRVPGWLAISLLASATIAPARAQLVFEFAYGPGMVALLGSDPGTATAIGAGMTEAAMKWSASLFDPITVKIAVDLDPTLPPAAFAAAAAVKIPTVFTSVASALGADALSLTDLSAVASLQPGPILEAITQDTSTLVVPSPETRLSGGPASDVWNTSLAVPRANLKSLGILSGTDGGAGADGTLTINPSAIGFFDFTRGDGITPGLFDFTGIAIHELGHLMGFSSGVDEVDFAGDGAPGSPADLSGTALFTVLDLFRYSPHSLLADSPPPSGEVNDWRFGPPPAAFLPKPYFSVDAGTTIVGAFATGSFHGDGDQASHFSSGVSAIMDPGFPPGILADPTVMDIAALDAIGWNAVPAAAVPEGSSGAVVAAFAGLAGLVGWRKCRR